MARLRRGLCVAGVCLGVVLTAVGAAQAVDSPPAEGSVGASRSPAGVVPVAQKPKPARKKARGKRATARPAEPAEKADDAEAAKPQPAPASDGALKFSRDIAPILVGNCVGCHNERQRRGKFDLTTFEKLMKGADKEKVIEPGKPEESHLVLRVRGEETPRMPQGGNRTLSEASVAKIEQWVKAGAVLDAGIDPKAQLASYAASADDLRKLELAKMTAEERDKQVEASGLDRWKKANPKVKPEVTNGTHFMLFGALPQARAAAAVKAVDSAYAGVKDLLGPASVDWGEKGSVFVFNDAASYGEFVRANENRDVEAGDLGTSRFTVAHPYVAVIDPLGGLPESAAPARRPARTKRAGDDDAVAAGSDRSLAGLLIENLVIGAAARAGKPPRWVTLGLGALVASRVERGSPYYAKLRREAYQLGELGWNPKAVEALADTTKTEDVRAVGFAVMEWLASVNRSLPGDFAKGMLAGGDKLDDVIGKVLNGNRQDFLDGSGQFVLSRAGR